MANYNLPLVYTPGGINLKIPETLRNSTEAADGLNFDLTPSLDLVKRTGFHMRADDDLGYGLSIHENREPVTLAAVGFGDFNFGEDAFGSPTSLGLGTIEPQLVGLGGTPKLWTQGCIAIEYTGTGTATVTVEASGSSTIQLVLTEDGSAVLTSDLGSGTETSPTTVSDLETAIDAVTDFSATVTGTSTTPAAFIDMRGAYTLTANTPHDIDFGYWTTINSPITTPLSELTDRVGRADFENPTTTNLNSIMYIADGFDAILKYDGQNLYNAGLPAAPLPTLNVDSGTPSAAGMTGVYTYKTQYRQIDNMNLSYEGAISSASASADNSAGPYEIEVTVTNIAASTGYNTNGAITVGAHSSTNVGASQERINVDDGAGGDHTLQVGDTAYLYDNTSSSYITAEVLARTTSTITLSYSTTLSVSDNMPISNNLRIEIWRTEGGGSTYSLLVEIPNDSFNTTQVYSDIIADDSLGASFSAPSKVPAVPTACKYAVTWKNQLILAGDPLNPGRVYYSEYDGTTLSGENFPAVNFFDIAIGARGSSVISGIAVLSEDLIIFTEDRCFWAAGDLVTDTITVSEISDNVGCVAAGSIASSKDGLYFLAKTGIYRISPSAQRSLYIVDKVSGPIDPIFLRGADNDFKDSRKRAVGVLWPAVQKYILYLPDAAAQYGEWHSQDSSRLWVYSIERDLWMQWSNIHALGGMLVWDDDTTNSEDILWFHTRQLNDAGTAVIKQLFKMNHTDTESDYADHVDAISMEYRAQWDMMGSPRIQKLYNELSIDAFRSFADLKYTPSGTITVDVYRDFDASTAEVSFSADYLANNQEIIRALPRSLRRSLALKFSNNTINKQILISGWTLEGFRLNNNIRR